MRTWSRGMIAAALLLLVVGATTSLRAQAPQWNVGDVFAAIGNGQYNVYSITGSTGVLKQTITDSLTKGSGATAGCAFDSAYRLFTTNFTKTNIVRFAIDNAHTGVVQTISGGVTTGFRQSESVAFDGQGNFYVGYADTTSSASGGGLELYNHNGELYNHIGVLNSFSPTTENSGVDWIDVASDGHTVFYTSEGRKIFMFDTTSSAPSSVYVNLSNVPSGNNGKLFAIRILPPGDGSGGVLVADQKNIKQVSAAGGGTIVRTYSVGNQSDWEVLNLDPNGTSFWAGDATTHNFYRFNISTGNVELGAINTGPSASLGGICVDGAFSAAQLTGAGILASDRSPFPTPATQPFSLSAGSNTLVFTSPITGTRFTATLANLTNSAMNPATVTLRDSLVDPSVAQSDPTVFSFNPGNPNFGSTTVTTFGNIPCDQTLPALADPPRPDTCEVLEFEASPNSEFSGQNVENVEIDKSLAVSEATPNLRLIRNLDEDITDGVIQTPLIGTKKLNLCVFTVNQQASNSGFDVCGGGFSSPAAGTTFIKNQTSTIDFKFKVAQHGTCPNGPSPTNPLVPLLEIVQLVPPAAPVSQPIIVAGKSGGFPIFAFSGGTWQLQVKTTMMAAGFTYLATVIDLSSPPTIPSFSVMFSLK